MNYYESPPTNVAGIVGFVLSIFSVLTVGCLAPVALLVSLSGISQEPKGLAIAGAVISAIAMIPFLLIFAPILFGFILLMFKSA